MGRKGLEGLLHLKNIWFYKSLGQGCVRVVQIGSLIYAYTTSLLPKPQKNRIKVLAIFVKVMDMKKDFHHGNFYSSDRPVEKKY